MNSIEIWKLTFEAPVAINNKFAEGQLTKIQQAIVKAINENSDHNLLLGDALLHIEGKKVLDE